MEVVTARQAFNDGKTRYYTGEACKHGHIAERMISNGSCVECLNQKREYLRKWKKENPDKRAAYAKKYAAKHPETHKKAYEKYKSKNIEEIRRRAREGKARMRVSNPEREKLAQIRYYIKKENSLVEKAGSPRSKVCNICGNIGKTVFDHCHKSGLFRGWLCDRCNRTLGQIQDNIELLLKMALYLEVNNEKSQNDCKKAPRIA